jgi:ADP-L-glycero-D-manno-heptose 6-epimerase
MIIVTGGAGFIGSNLIRGLNRISEKNILVVDDLTNGEKHMNLNSLSFSDYMDKGRLLQSLRDSKHGSIEAVFHEGACTDTMESDGSYMLENNYEYSKILLNYCLDNRIPFIYASSASVYGDGVNGFKETASCEFPLNIYAFSKFLFDRYVRTIMPEVKSQVAGLRYFNVYGPQESHKGKMASVINHFHNEIKSEGRMKLFEGSNNFSRDFIYVDDIVDINLHFFSNPSISGIYNCGTGRAESFLRIAEIMKECNPGSRIDFIPFPPELKGKYQAYTQADLTLLRRSGYSKEFTAIENGVALYAGILNRSAGYYMN